MPQAVGNDGPLGPSLSMGHRTLSHLERARTVGWVNNLYQHERDPNEIKTLPWVSTSVVSSSSFT